MWGVPSKFETQFMCFLDSSPTFPRQKPRTSSQLLLSCASPLPQMVIGRSRGCISRPVAGSVSATNNRRLTSERHIIHFLLRSEELEIAPEEVAVVQRKRDGIWFNYGGLGRWISRPSSFFECWTARRTMHVLHARLCTNVSLFLPEPQDLSKSRLASGFVSW